MSTIHGLDVNFHGENHHEVKDFLKNGMHGDTAKIFFERAKNGEDVEIKDPSGKNFKIKYEKGEDGKDNFSVRPHHY